MANYNFNNSIKTIFNYKAIAIILGLSISFQIYLYLYEDETTIFEINDIIVILPQLAVGIMSLVVAARYWGSSVFGRSYFALGLGFIFYFLGDVVWEYYEIFSI